MHVLIRVLCRCVVTLSGLALLGCETTSGPRGGEEDFPASIEIVEAEASIHRLADPEGDLMAEDFYMLRTRCVLRVDNRSGKDQEVLSYFGSAFDDLRLRVRDASGNKLATTTHTLWTDPLAEGQWHFLRTGETTVELSSATLVGPVVPDDDYPMIVQSELTPEIQLEYFGGFPGSDLARAIQSNRVSVRIADRTTVVPRREVPIPQTHV